MNEAAIKRRVNDLVTAITSSNFAGQTAKGTGKSLYQPEMPSGSSSVDSSLDHLRLQVKYLLFDLEATRRENRYLRQMLESRNRRDFEDLREDDSESP